MFTAGVKHRLRAIHTLAAEGGAEASPHAHDYVVGWSCETRDLNAKGYSVDISLLKQCLGSLCRRLQDSDLNALPFFASRTPSVENLAVLLTGELRLCLGPAAADIARSELTIWEADEAWASYAESWDAR